jgi:poly(3-hydroxybutyrate) depolymerase
MLIALALLLATPPSDRCVQVQSRKVCVQGPSAPGLPLLIYLHGFGGAGSDDSLRLQQYMGKARVLYAAPDALPNRDGQSEWRTADLAFLKELIERLIVSEHADESRVYLAGFSLGGFLALDFACRHPEHVTAVASVSGTRFAPATACVQGSVSTLQFHGENDTTVNPAGGVGKRTGMAYLSARAAAGIAAAAADCRTALTPLGQGVERASGCRDGAVVELSMLPRFGHLLPPMYEPIWRFLSVARKRGRGAP